MSSEKSVRGRLLVTFLRRGAKPGYGGAFSLTKVRVASTELRIKKSGRQEIPLTLGPKGLSILLEVGGQAVASARQQSFGQTLQVRFVTDAERSKQRSQ